MAGMASRAGSRTAVSVCTVLTQLLNRAAQHAPRTRRKQEKRLEPGGTSNEWQRATRDLGT